MSNKRPAIEMLLSSTEDSSTEEEIYFSPIKKPRLIKVSKKCEDKDCYFCNIIKKDCSNEDITIFKKT